jgi:hypothetical protein
MICRCWCELLLTALSAVICLLPHLSGPQVHLQENPFLHNLFDFSPLNARPDKLSAQEKRAFRSPCSAASKARSQARRSQRSFKGGSSAADW